MYLFYKYKLYVSQRSTIIASRLQVTRPILTIYWTCAGFPPYTSYTGNRTGTVSSSVLSPPAETRSRTWRWRAWTCERHRLRCTRSSGRGTGSCKQTQSCVARHLLRTDLQNHHGQICGLAGRGRIVPTYRFCIGCFKNNYVSSMKPTISHF